MTRKTIATAVIVLGLLPGCARLQDSPINPMNWFGGNETEAGPVPRSELPDLVPPQKAVRTVDRREAVAAVSEVVIARRGLGVLVQATGLAPTPGFYNAALVPVAGGAPGELRLAFRAQRPAAIPAGVASDAARRIVVAQSLPPEALAGITRITVTARDNAISKRR